MEARCLEFALLLWLPGMLHALPAQPCSAPSLDEGFFLPVKESYPDGTKIRYVCNDGYKPSGRGWWGTSTCLRGKWLDGPVCVESLATCTEPPKRPNAIIINQDYQEVFAVDTEVEYQCKDGYTTEEGATKKSVFCRAGRWTDGPTCTPSARPGSNRTEQSIISIDNCGKVPEVPNAVVAQGQRSLQYRCVKYYTLVGPDTVVCLSGGNWSDLPTCKENFCVLRAGEYPDLQVTVSKYLTNGDEEEMKCVDRFWFPSFSLVRCINGGLYVSKCCNRAQINLGTC